MARITVTLQVKIAWWWPAYVAGVQFMSRLTGLEPDPAKVERWPGGRFAFAQSGLINGLRQTREVYASE